MKYKYTFMDALEMLGESFPPDSLKYYGDLKITAKEVESLMNKAYEQGIKDASKKFDKRITEV